MVLDLVLQINKHALYPLFGNKGGERDSERGDIIFVRGVVYDRLERTDYSQLPLPVTHHFTSKVTVAYTSESYLSSSTHYKFISNIP